MPKIAVVFCIVILGSGITAFLIATVRRGGNGIKRLRTRDVRAILESLRNAFGFTVYGSLIALENYAEGKMGAFRVLVRAAPPRPSSDGPPDLNAAGAPENRFCTTADYVLLVRLTGRCFSRRAVEITKRPEAPGGTVDAGEEPELEVQGDRPPDPWGRLKITMEALRAAGRRAADSGDPSASRWVRLDWRDFGALNDLLGTELFSRAFLNDLEFLASRSTQLSILSGELAIGVPFRTLTGEIAGRVVATAAGVASRLAETSAQNDWYLPALCLGLRRAADKRRRTALLRTIAAEYPDEPLARRASEELLGDPDFSLALEAAEFLRLDLFAFVTGRIDGLGHTDRALALEALCELKTRAAAGFVLRFFSHTDSAFLRQSVIDAYRENRDGRGMAVFLAGADDRSREVKLAAAEALVEQGDARALGALYRLSRDDSLPEELRVRLGETVELLKVSASADDLGLLSLAGKEAAEGGLSVPRGIKRKKPSARPDRRKH